MVVPFHRNRDKRFFGLAYSGKDATEARFGRVRKLHNGKCGRSNVDDQGNNRTGERVAAQTDPNDG